ncbi:MAG: caspase family protein [Leptolyngbya sp. RL_3_1]|nr:caspase family protein [Leptolyngbya sp. RL_3_1]
MGQASTYQQALAKPASRRLALLVGINNYPESVWQGSTGKGMFLRGCTTDVELQRALLIHQFGFAPDDIVTLVNGEATQAKILAAVDQHLINQAQPGDSVLFHFSGLGSTVKLSEYPNKVFPTLVPVDGVLPKAASPVVKDLFESVLVERLSQVRAAQLITVIDASSVTLGEPLQGNCRVRARPWVPTGNLPPQPAGADAPAPDPFASVRSGRSPSWPGLVLRPSSLETPALENDWDGFSAGLFTYTLTQTLWTAPPHLSKLAALRRAGRRAERWVGQGIAAPPQRGSSDSTPKALYGEERRLAHAVDGVVQEVNPEAGSARLWLGGIDAMVLAHSAALRFKPILPTSRLQALPTTLRVKHRTGLTAEAQIVGKESVTVGTGVIEAMRSLPRDIALTVALDQRLERIERVDATSALAGIPHIAAVIAGEQMADCVFGQPLALPAPTLTASTITGGDGAALETPPAALSPSGYGLFTPNQTPIPGTVKDQGEAVKTAVGRLSDRLQTLLAVKLLRLTRNPTASELPVRLTTEAAESAKQILGGEETSSARQYRRQTDSPEEMPAILGTPDQAIRHLRFRIHNLGRRALYSIAIVLDHRGNLSIYCPNVADLPSPETAAETTVAPVTLAPDAQQALPSGDTGWLLKPMDEALEIFAVLGIAPFRNTWATLQQQGALFQRDRFIPIRQPLPLVQALLADLDAASTGEKEAIGVEANPAHFQLCSSAWATLSIRSS